MKTKSPARAKRPPYELEKISMAIAEECAETGMAIDKFLALRPCQKMGRLSDRMKRWGFRDDEVPKEKVFREYWKHLKSDQLREMCAAAGGRAKAGDP
jgi:hypothetical protein